MIHRTAPMTYVVEMRQKLVLDRVENRINQDQPPVQAEPYDATPAGDRSLLQEIGHLIKSWFVPVN